MSDKTAFPLCWPDGRPRTPAHHRIHARFQTSFGRARTALCHEIKLLAGSNVIMSSDIPVRNDGLPYAALKPRTNDTGIAVYFHRNGKQLCFACDRYLLVDDNLHAIALTVKALRGIARWGTGDMMEQAFRGYAALPERASRSWWEVLGVPVNAQRDEIQAAYARKMRAHHPDTGDGDVAETMVVAEAWAHAKALFQGNERS